MTEKISIGVIIFALIVLFIALSQPVWRGEEMANNFKSDCNLRGGVLIERKSYLGITYKCLSRLDN